MRHGGGRVSFMACKRDKGSEREVVWTGSVPVVVRSACSSTALQVLGHRPRKLGAVEVTALLRRRRR